MADYSWVTDEMFDEKLKEMVDYDLNEAISPFDVLMSISTDIYEILSEHYNNDILNELEADKAENSE